MKTYKRSGLLISKEFYKSSQMSSKLCGGDDKIDFYEIMIFHHLLFWGLQNLGLTRGVMSFKLIIPSFKIDIKKIIFLLKFNS